MSAGIEDFIAAMRAAGVEPLEPIAGRLREGRLIRFRCRGDGRKRNGWAIFFPEDPRAGKRAAGAFGNYKLGTGSITWSARRAPPPLAREEAERMRAAIAAENARRAQAQQCEQEAVARAAQACWAEAGPVDRAHPYAARKRLMLQGLRQAGAALLVPMRDGEGRIWNLQRIYPDGSKRFLRGGRVQGLMAVIAPRRGFARGVVCEGYATGDAIAQACGGPVVVAFTTANLGAVVAVCLARHPRADWVIAADDDHATALKLVARGKPYHNPGLSAARAAALAHGCRIACPPTVASRQADPLGGAARNTDFSDLLLAGEVEAIRAAVTGALRPQGSACASLAEQLGRAAA
jgi:putative DNA primase/helicase